MGLHLPYELNEFRSEIKDAASASGIPASILAAQIWQESRGNIRAVTRNSGNGLSDAGLMQINRATFDDIKRKYPNYLERNADPSDPGDNIMAGALNMRDLKRQFNGNIRAALRAYNSGPLNVNLDDLSDISRYGTGDSTYVKKVMRFADIISTGEGRLPA